MTCSLDRETSRQTITASLQALTRTKEGVVAEMELLRATFRRIEHYKEISPCARALAKTERALREAFEAIDEAHDDLTLA